MRLKRTIGYVCGLQLLITLAACNEVVAPVTPVVPPVVTPPVVTPPVVVAEPIDTAAARLAWTFVENNTQSATGLAKPIYPFQFPTVWDIGSLIGATYSAHELGIITDADYDARIQRILGTLGTLELFDNVAFNKTYDAQTGGMVDRNRVASATGYGWSATDIGRLLVWLRIVAVNQPQYAAQAARIVARLDMSRLVAGGILHGMDLDPVFGTRNPYAETGLGYEQYAAAGFALWGHRAATALDASINAKRVDLYGVSISVDARDNGRLTSEPYVMLGLETGWYSSDLRDQAMRLLAAQEARFTNTGVMTMVSEDALPDPPYYYYYYTLYGRGQGFVVEGPEDRTPVEQPRWVSTKAAFAWRALLPSSYTKAALASVQSAAVPGRGWGSGVYEQSGAPTGEPGLNTAALVLESIAYRKLGHAFIGGMIR
jgi:hypothetical protein